MGGKGAILLVLGFSTIFLMFGHRFNSVSSDAVDNASNYYAHVQAYNISVSAANIAASNLFFNPTWQGTTNVRFNGGLYSVRIDTVIAGSSDSVSVQDINRNSVRLKLPNPNGERLKIAYINSKYHINGQDLSNFTGDDKKIIENETIIVLRPTNMAYFGNYYRQMTAFPATGDVFDGPFHVNSTLTTYGSPTFTGRVTTKDGVIMKQTPPPPDFQEEVQSGINVDPPFNAAKMQNTAQSNGVVFRDTTGHNRKVTLSLKFHKNGDVTYKQKIGWGRWSTAKRVSLIDLAPNGTIFVEKGDVYVKGTLNGRVSVVASSKKVGYRRYYGKIYQTDDLRYAYRADPTHYRTPDDMLGLVAEESIILDYNSNTRHHDIYTDAVMYSQNGKVGPDSDLIDNDGYLRDWKIFGSIAASDIQATAHYRRQWVNGQYIFAPYEGYRFVQQYNNSVNSNAPPSYPESNKFQVVNWLERRIFKKGQDL